VTVGGNGWCEVSIEASGNTVALLGRAEKIVLGWLSGRRWWFSVAPLQGGLPSHEVGEGL
jgi:hypothetical protein